MFSVLIRASDIAKMLCGRLSLTHKKQIFNQFKNYKTRYFQSNITNERMSNCELIYVTMLLRPNKLNESVYKIYGLDSNE